MSVITVGGVLEVTSGVMSVGAVAGAFTPLSISDLGLWIDFSDISTLWQDTGGSTAVTTDLDPIKRVDDKSGNSFNITNAPGNFVYNASQQNGRSTGTRSTGYLESTSPQFTPPCTYLLAVDTTGWFTSQVMWDAAVNNGRHVLFHTSGVPDGIRFSSGSDLMFTDLEDESQQWHVLTITVEASGGSMNSYIDGSGTPSATTAMTATITSDGFRLGASVVNTLQLQPAVHIGEILVYEKILAGAEKTNAENYLLSRWT